MVDAASIEVNRRLRRAKTDRLDASRLLSLLVRFAEGERSVWSVVHVPSSEEEDRRHLHRELLTAKRDRTRPANRLQGLLANQGVRADWRKPLPAQLSKLRLWDGSALPAGLCERLGHEWDRLELLNQQIERREQIREVGALAGLTPTPYQSGER